MNKRIGILIVLLTLALGDTPLYSGDDVTVNSTNIQQIGQEKWGPDSFAPSLSQELKLVTLKDRRLACIWPVEYEDIRIRSPGGAVYEEGWAMLDQQR